MVENRMLLECCERILKNVSPLSVVSTEDMTGHAFSSDEEVVSSLEFTGDVSGIISMILPAGDIEAISNLILQRFNITVPMEHSIIFAEMINIYAGNLVTEFKKFGIEISISIPLKTHPVLESESGSTNVIRVLTDNDFTYKFYVFLREAAHDKPI